jgi:peptidoglycan hydrolase CwlO-like protein
MRCTHLREIAMTRRRRFSFSLLASSVVSALVLTGSGVAEASHEGSAHQGGSDLAALVTDVAEASQRVAAIGADIQARQEGVNKALVDVARTRDSVEATRGEVVASERSLADANTAITLAQKRFDEFAAASYVNGPSGSYLTATTPEDVVVTAIAGQTLAVSFQQAKANLQRARTEQANRASLARAARQHAEIAAAEAERSQGDAVTALGDAQQQFASQQAEVDRLVAARDAAQRRLDAAQPPSAPRVGAPPEIAPAAPVAADQWDRNGAPATSTASTTSQWDTTIPMVPSANVPGDPVAIINAVLQISATSAQVTADMGRNFVTKLGILPQPAAAADPGFTNGRIPRVYGRQASEFVIRRAGSQMGPLLLGRRQRQRSIPRNRSGCGHHRFRLLGIDALCVRGGGHQAGPLLGLAIRRRPQDPVVADAPRGLDLLRAQRKPARSVKYLGDGMMLEAPYTGSQVKVSPVRTSGMTPYVTRLIEY